MEKGRANWEKEVVPTKVFWDIDSYPLPAEEEECWGVVKNLSAAIRMNCCCRAITMTSFGNPSKLSLPVRRFLSQAMLLNCTTPESIVETMQNELNYWAEGVHAPANYVIVSNNKFTSTLEDLCSRNYNVFLAHPDGYPVDHAPAATASCVWSFRRVETLYPVSTVPRRLSSSCTEELIPKEEKEVVPTKVFWDIDSYPLPAKEEECRGVVKNLRAAIHMNCSCRVITMNSYGYPFKLSLPVRRFLRQAMVLHCTTPESHVETMQRELNNWTKRVPAPANYVIVSKNKFTSTLDDLCSRNYNVLLAHPDGYPVDHAPAATASCVWSFRRVKTLYPVSSVPRSVPRTEQIIYRQKKEVPTSIVVYKRKERQWDSHSHGLSNHVDTR